MSAFVKTAEHYVPGSKTLPQKYYTKDDVFAREQERIFKQYWTCVGHQSRIPNAGDYFVFNLFGESLIILRDQAGQIRAFYNVCRHRGTRICEAGDGRFSSSIQCSYHAWTYGLDGKLIGAPFMKDVPDFRWEDFPLRAAPCTIWEGFVFVSLSLEAPRPFEDVYAPLLGRFSRWNIASLRSYRRVSYDVKSNWKYIFQNFNECYHCPTIHPALSRLSDYTSGENDLTEGPILGGFMEITGGESLTMTGHSCALPLGSLSPDEGRRGYYYSILGNLLLNLHPDYLMFHLVLPQAPGRSLILSEWLFNPEAFSQRDFNPEDALAFWDETNLQDWHVCELGQLGVSSQAYVPGWYTPRESLPAAFDRQYLKLIGDQK